MTRDNDTDRRPKGEAAQWCVCEIVDCDKVLVCTRTTLFQHPPHVWWWTRAAKLPRNRLFLETLPPNFCNSSFETISRYWWLNISSFESSIVLAEELSFWEAKTRGNGETLNYDVSLEWGVFRDRISSFQYELLHSWVIPTLEGLRGVEYLSRPCYVNLQ